MSHILVCRQGCADAHGAALHQISPGDGGPRCAETLRSRRDLPKCNILAPRHRAPSLDHPEESPLLLPTLGSQTERAQGKPHLVLVDFVLDIPGVLDEEVPERRKLAPEFEKRPRAQKAHALRVLPLLRECLPVSHGVEEIHDDAELFQIESPGSQLFDRPVPECQASQRGPRGHVRHDGLTPNVRALRSAASGVAQGLLGRCAACRFAERRDALLGDAADHLGKPRDSALGMPAGAFDGRAVSVGSRVPSQARRCCGSPVRRRAKLLPCRRTEGERRQQDAEQPLEKLVLLRCLCRHHL
mmetsp:Transcript_92959/g.267445  ORF Transcript_92959/g.267445 Transcript_92959/m.267445 type:complete len:300 (+) Transcript_92959:864-1763(+)